MNGKQLLEKMDLIDPQFIEEADRMPRKKPVFWQQWGALAASLAIALIAGLAVVFLPDNNIPITGTGDTASIFGDGGIALVVLMISLLAAVGITAHIIRKTKDSEKDDDRDNK